MSRVNNAIELKVESATHAGSGLLAAVNKYMNKIAHITPRCRYPLGCCAGLQCSGKNGFAGFASEESNAQYFADGYGSGTGNVIGIIWVSV
ncbi:MAG: hypothetical protein CMI02_17340 [Oceanospirillaceae bacterium]|nr:hypothetical protein [Oceanospirillaceae bacterium]MBT13787.1 hypothetical protein [Oceanospirillaceae bacterium]|tara:strand:- start:32974 stop:33246 length:273 start_codon:yes stop_codon:yes gene_type:complete